MPAAAILIVEDNPANLELMRYLLEAFGYAARCAHDGAEGIAMACAQVPDLVLCDVQMPGIDGYQVLRRLREDPNTEAVPVVAVTALAMVGDRDRTLAAGFDGYLSKPIDPMTFVHQVEAFILPALRVNRAHSRQAPTGGAPVPRGGKGTILAVDNLRDNLDFVVTLFESSGYRVIATENARDAVDLARTHRPDLILSDVCMPQGSGYELVRAVRTDPILRQIPFVLITSTVTTQADRRHGLALGADRFLIRPIEPQDLLAEIEGCLASRTGYPQWPSSS